MEAVFVASRPTARWWVLTVIESNTIDVGQVVPVICHFLYFLRMMAAMLNFGSYRCLTKCNPRFLFRSYPNKIKSITISLRASDSYGIVKSIYGGLHNNTNVDFVVHALQSSSHSPCDNYRKKQLNNNKGYAWPQLTWSELMEPSVYCLIYRKAGGTTLYVRYSKYYDIIYLITCCCYGFVYLSIWT